MKRWLVVFLVVALMPSFSLFAQTISVSVTDWLMLRTELSISKKHLAKLNEQVKNLEESLEKAKLEQQNSKISISDSKEKILDLERHLAAAVQRRDQLQSTVDSLKSQLTELSKSLSDTQKILDKNEEKHVKNIIGLSQKYERKLLIKNIFIGGLAAVIVVETVVLLIKSIAE